MESAERTLHQPTLRPMDGAIRLMREDDLDAVHAIEEKAFATPWSKRSMRTMLKDNEHSYCIVCQRCDETVGYAFTWIVGGEMHIANIAAHESKRRQGIGGAVMNALIDAARNHACAMCWLEVRESNAPARRLYEKLGFAEFGVRKRYYADTDEDAIVMAKRL